MRQTKFCYEKYQNQIESRLAKLREEKIIERIWQKDHTVWSEDPTEISNRLGWLDSPSKGLEQVDEINHFVNEIINEGFTNALLLGMGGSSLAPEVFRLTFGVSEGYLDLAVLDSTDPGAVIDKTKNLDLEKTLFIVSTKSGGTVETISFMKYCFNLSQEKLGTEKAPENFIAITDPGSGLEQMAKDLNFRKIFLNDPDIGGRFSALSLFGLVPAALVGIDLRELLKAANNEADASKNTEDFEINIAAKIGVMMGALANKGVDKVTLISSAKLKYFGAWAEQLIAESMGKFGKGILPVDLEEVLQPDEYSKDRVFVYLKLKDESESDEQVSALIEKGFPVVQLELDNLYALGAEFLSWEIATAISGWVIGVQPFDQPNVEEAKVKAREMMAAYKEKGELPKLDVSLTEDQISIYGDVSSGSIKEALNEFLDSYNPGENEIKDRSYVALQAYVRPTEETTNALQGLRTKIQKKYKLATTVGYGPRFLHSTGQLHKGDAGHGLFIQFTANMPEDINIPDNPGEDSSLITFGVLKNAQALGDRQALLDNDRKFIRIDLGNEVGNGLTKLASYLD
ncbi:MAG: glucose-6-phosphate isomerase [Ignavibacteria bacterium]|jgi:glucose-6-phosphate isomerase